MSSIAYLGPEGTHTHRAAMTLFPEGNLIPYPSIPSLTAALDKGEISQAVLPLENSLEGTVSETFDYLLTSSKKITAEVSLSIEHVLAGAKGIKLSELTLIASHPQALAQCSAYTASLGLPTLPTVSTVAAVEEVVKNKTTAAIVSALAAELYHLDILAKNIADYENNMTRFCVLSDSQPQPTGRDKTSIIFEIADRPGSLYEILRIFSEAQINLSKIESRPAKYRLGKYLFAIDFEGHYQEKHAAEILNLLEKQCIFLKVLGSYPKYEY